MLVLAEAQALQSPITVERGIGRYVSEYARAVDQNHHGVVGRWVLRPDLPLPAHVPRMLAGDRFIRQDDVVLRVPPDVWHVTSPFEALREPLDVVIPTWARRPRTRLVTTLYDLIPLVYPERYLADPAVKRAYTARLQIVRSAERVLSISEATANDAVRLLGVPARRIDVVGTGVSERFVPPADTGASLRRALAAVPGLRPGYVMYTGGIDFRKNIDGLLLAYAKLPAILREAHQLLIVCRVSAGEREHLTRAAGALGIADQMVLSGFVPDDALLDLYQGAHLFVFPSLYEGFGLPVVEALSCGVPVLIGNNSSLTELVQEPRAQFDAAVPDDIARAIFTALTDDAFREELRATAVNTDYRWNVVAERSVEAYARTMGTRTRGDATPLVAFVTPMPPAASGVADYSRELLEALAARARVHVFTSPEAAPFELPNTRWYTYQQMGRVEALHGTPDLRLYAMGNSEHHVDVYRLFRRFGGTVMAHDVRYSGLVGVLLERAPELVDDDAAATVSALWAGKRPEHHADHIALPPEEYYSVNGLLAGSVLAGAERVLVHSRVAKSMAAMEMAPEERPRIEIVPFGHRVRDPWPFERRDAVVSMGIVHWMKESATVCRAFVELARRFPEITFALVGDVLDAAMREELRALLEGSGVAGRVVVTGRVDAAEYQAWVHRARVAVQLRVRSNGESSAAVADCLGAGVPVVATDVGSMSDLSDVCTLVPPRISPDALVAVVADLLDDEDQLRERAERAHAFAVQNTFDATARAVLGPLDAPRRRVEDPPTIPENLDGG